MTDATVAATGGSAGVGGAGIAGSAGSAGTAGGAGIGGAAGSGPVGCPTITVAKLTDDDAPLALLVDPASQALFWSASAPDGKGYEHRLRRLPRDGGEPQTLYTSPAELAALGDNGDEIVFFEIDILASTARLLGVPKTGGDPREIKSLTGVFDRVDRFGFGARDGFAYGIGVTIGQRFVHEVFSIDLANGNIASLATFELDFASDVRGLSVTDEAISLAYLGGDLYRLPRATSSVLFDLAPAWTSTSGVDALVGDGAETIVLSNGFVRRIDTKGIQSPLVEDTSAYRGLAKQGTVLAWGERSHEGEERIRLRAEDGTLCLVADEDVISVLDVRLDGDRLYWVNTASREAGGAVWSAKLGR